jgi:hypothetical protein
MNRDDYHLFVYGVLLATTINMVVSIVSHWHDIKPCHVYDRYLTHLKDYEESGDKKELEAARQLRNSLWNVAPSNKNWDEICR